MCLDCMADEERMAYALRSSGALVAERDVRFAALWLAIKEADAGGTPLLSVCLREDGRLGDITSSLLGGAGAYCGVVLPLAVGLLMACECDCDRDLVSFDKLDVRLSLVLLVE